MFHRGVVSATQAWLCCVNLIGRSWKTTEKVEPNNTQVSLEIIRIFMRNARTDDALTWQPRICSRQEMTPWGSRRGQWASITEEGSVQSRVKLKVWISEGRKQRKVTGRKSRSDLHVPSCKSSVPTAILTNFLGTFIRILFHCYFVSFCFFNCITNFLTASLKEKFNREGGKLGRARKLRILRSVFLVSIVRGEVHSFSNFKAVGK